MRRLLAGLLLFGLACGASAQVPGPGGPPGPAAAPAPRYAAARTAANLDLFVSTMDPTANGGVRPFADMQEFDAQACWSAGGAFCSSVPSNIIAFGGSGTTSTTVTATLGNQTLTLGSSAWCTQKMAGQPLYIAGITAPGTLMTGCLSSNRISISKPVLVAAAGTTMTIRYGVYFTATCPPDLPAAGVTGCVGSIIITPGWTGSQGISGSTMTVTAVNSTTNVTMSLGSANVVNDRSAHFLIGHDDSTAVNAACATALARGVILQVATLHLTPAIDRKCYGVLLRGSGRLATGEGNLTGALTVYPEPLVIPWSAAAPSPPRRGLIAKRDLPVTAAAGVSPSLAFVYDSLATLEPNNLNESGAYPALFASEMLAQNSGLRPVSNLCGVGGATVLHLDGNPALTSPPCITSTGSTFLSQVASNAAPHVMDIGGTNNDGTAFSVAVLADVFIKATTPAASGGAFTTPIDMVFTAHHPYSRIAANQATVTPIELSMDYSNGYLMSFAEVMHRPMFDGATEGEKHLWGYDPTALKFERAFDIPYGSNVLGLPSNYYRRIKGFAATFTKAGVAGNTFWSSFTGGGGVTDSRGPFFAMNIGYDQGQKNWLWLFQLASNKIGIQCDPMNTLPGMGCNDPATGLPPVIPSLMGSITVSAANPAVITTTTGFVWPCTIGMTVAVPSAGAAQSVGGFGSYTEPWITQVTVCTSNTSITGTGAAPTPGTYASSFVMSGNPIINTQMVDVGDGAGNEKFHVELKGSDLILWWNTKAQPIYIGKIMRPRADFGLKFFSGGLNPSITIATDVATLNQTSFMIAKPVPVMTDFTDADVNGPSASVVVNAGYIGPSGGDGNNHNTDLFGERILKPMYAAADFTMPTASGITTVVPTTGQTIVVPNRVGKYIVNPAGTLAALTITMPTSGFNLGDTLQIAFRQAITSGTISAATGQTINGAALSAASIAINTTLTYAYVGAATWQRTQ